MAPQVKNLSHLEELDKVTPSPFTPSSYVLRAYLSKLKIKKLKVVSKASK